MKLPFTVRRFGIAELLCFGAVVAGVALIGVVFNYGSANATTKYLTSAAAEQGHVTTGRVPTPTGVSNDALELLVGGISRPLTNGSEITIAGDLQAQLTFSAGDKHYFRNLDLYLYHLDSTRPEENATIELTGRMRYMDHGTFRQVAIPLGGGHYLLPLEFPMPGEWQMGLDIGAAGSPSSVIINLDLFD
ncbi:MAG: hypothetical protein HY326_12325 [Chloroflexi bacterium]|nr:hypothetical protein [Chloroflexota bacterium]